jgi:hypothetical protein
MKLPPANKIPIDRSVGGARLGRARQQLLASLIADETIYYLRKTRTKVDVGAWFRKGRVCICLSAREAILFATGSRPYIERIPIQQLCESRYNHVTGELMLAPEAAPGIRGLKIPPLEGLAVLAQIHWRNKP